MVLDAAGLVNRIVNVWEQEMNKPVDNNAADLRKRMFICVPVTPPRDILSSANSRLSVPFDIFPFNNY